MTYPQQPDGYAHPQHRQPGFAPSQQPQQFYGQAQPQPYPQPGYQGHPHAAGKRYLLRGAEGFWYVLGCIGMGGAYFAKLPVKKAACEILSELQLDGRGPSNGYGLGGAESFWYILMCIACGGGYFAKVSAKKALWELVTVLQSAPGENTDAIFRALRGTAAAY